MVGFGKTVVAVCIVFRGCVGFVGVVLVCIVFGWNGLCRIDVGRGWRLVQDCLVQGRGYGDGC